MLRQARHLEARHRCLVLLLPVVGTGIGVTRIKAQGEAVEAWKVKRPSWVASLLELGCQSCGRVEV